MIGTYRLRIAIPGANEQAVKDLIHPDFPLVVESEAVGPDPDHAPAIEQDDSHGYGVEHGLGGELEAFLDHPEGEDTHRLGENADDEEVCQFERVVRYDGVLEGGDDGDGGVEGVTEEKVACGCEHDVFVMRTSTWAYQ